MELSNRFYRLLLCPQTGSLLSLLPAGETKSLITGIGVQYQADGVLWAEASEHPLAQQPVAVSVRKLRGEVRSILRTGELEIERSFKVVNDSPLLRIRYEFRGRKTATLHGPNLLILQLIDDVNNVASDEKDLYFDGAELPGSKELPCWRVMYRKGYKRGILVATRSKVMMGHLLYEARSIHIRPHVSAQQEVNYVVRDIPIQVKPGSTMVVEFEVGPWTAARHRSLLDAASLQKPVRVITPKVTKPKPAPKAGISFWFADHVARKDVATTFDPNKWLELGLPWNPRKKVLLANTGCRPRSFEIKPHLKGPCHIYVAGSRSASVGLHFSGDPYPMHRFGIGGTAFHSALHGQNPSREMSFGVVDITDKTIRVIANHNGHWPARLDYLRIAPLSASQAKAWHFQQQHQPRTLLAGIPDCGDLFFNLMDHKNLDPRLIQGNIWEQAKAGLTRLYWQMHGSYTSYQTHIGTRMPMICYGHGAFEPQIKSMPLFHRKHDLLALAAKTCHELGLEFWGAMRMNAYMSGKRDDFFKQRPQHAEITEDGTLSGNKICYAIPEVRHYHRSILVEAAGYGLQGIMLCTLRQPPLLLYHPAIVSGYRARYGKFPPRQPGRPDPFYTSSLPPVDEESMQWFAFRAQYMTAFVRELKDDLRQRGLSKTKISVWIRPNHCLFDGIDLETWLREGLCDEVVCDAYSPLPLDEPTAAWRKKVQSHVPLIRGIGFAETMLDLPTLSRVLTENYDGFCAYGSEQFPQCTTNEPLIDLLRTRP